MAPVVYIYKQFLFYLGGIRMNISINFLLDLMFIFTAFYFVMGLLCKVFIPCARKILYKDNRVLLEAEVMSYKTDIQFSESSRSYKYYYPVVKIFNNGTEVIAETKTAWTEAQYQELPEGTKVYVLANPYNVENYSIAGIMGKTNEEKMKIRIKNGKESLDGMDKAYFIVMGAFFALAWILFIFALILSAEANGINIVLRNLVI